MTSKNSWADILDEVVNPEVLDEPREKIEEETVELEAVSRHIVTGYGVFIGADGSSYLIFDPKEIEAYAAAISRPCSSDEVRRAAHDVSEYLLVKRITDAVAAVHG